MTDDDFDYQAYTRENPPNPARINYGKEARERRRAAAIARLATQTERSCSVELLALEKPTLQMVNANQSKPIEEWEAVYPELWLLIEVTREDFSQVYEGKLLAVAESPAEFIELKKSLRQQKIVNLTTRGDALSEQPAIWTKL